MIAPVALIVIVRLNTIPGLSQVELARMDTRALVSALDSWAQAHGGQYPDSLEELLQLDANGQPFLRYHKLLPVDSWGNPFVYHPPASGGRPRIVSYGRDGKPGGEGEGADIDSATLEDDG